MPLIGDQRTWIFVLIPIDAGTRARAWACMKVPKHVSVDTITCLYRD